MVKNTETKLLLKYMKPKMSEPNPEFFKINPYANKTVNNFSERSELL